MIKTLKEFKSDMKANGIKVTIKTYSDFKAATLKNKDGCSLTGIMTKQFHEENKDKIDFIIVYKQTYKVYDDYTKVVF